MTEPVDTLRFERLEPGAVLPTRGSPLSAGLDVYCIEEVRVEARGRARARTGLAVAIPKGFYGRLAPRSGLAAGKGLDVLAGVLDADYRGEIICLLYNTSDEAVVLPQMSKMCQLIIERIITPSPVWAERLEATGRGAGGFGSTGS